MGVCFEIEWCHLLVCDCNVCLAGQQALDILIYLEENLVLHSLEETVNLGLMFLLSVV